MGGNEEVREEGVLWLETKGWVRVELREKLRSSGEVLACISHLCGSVWLELGVADAITSPRSNKLPDLAMRLLSISATPP